MGNNNSSRYGVVTQLQFDDSDIPKMIGSLNRTYLLEKSRVVSRSARERNFHVFYQMVGSDDEEFKSSLQISGEYLAYVGDNHGRVLFFLCVIHHVYMYLSKGLCFSYYA